MNFIEKNIRLFALHGIFCLVAFSLCCCGSDSDDNGSNASGTSKGKLNPDDYDVVKSAFKDLPKCTSDNEETLAFVKKEQTAYVCEDGEWVLDRMGPSTDDDDSDSDIDDEPSSSASKKSNGNDSDDDDSSDDLDDDLSSNSKMSSSRASSTKKSSSSTETKMYDFCDLLRDTVTYVEPGDVKVDSMTDERDGQVYKIVTIGKQTWMAENLNFDYSVKNEKGKVVLKSYCYGDTLENCDSYGRLYTWAAAMDSAGLFSYDGYSCGDSMPCVTCTAIRGICPEGWRLPHIYDWEKLFDAVDGDSASKVLKGDEMYWNSSTELGSDDYEFDARAGGFRGTDGTYEGRNEIAFFWTSYSASDSVAYCAYIGGFNRMQRASYTYWWNRDFNVEGSFSRKASALSVRCIKE
ncbi:MAG: hypothetical protein MJY99_03245 [Fibrobacter sp.]|nr:hypothetical protein [Fibrobacter sp.]